MGTWGDGIYDNDGALDELARLINFDSEEVDMPQFIAEVGLLAWLRPDELTSAAVSFRAELDEFGEAGLVSVPAATRAALTKLLADPVAGTRKSSRSAAARKVIGRYSEGPRIDALLRLPGAEVVIAELGERAAQRLDVVLARKGGLDEAASGPSALGVLIELKQAALWPAGPARVDRWREGFAAIDAATQEERKFWARYVQRVKAGFDLLAPSERPPVVTAAKMAKVAKPAPRVLRELPVATRYEHPKFGVGTVVTRFGSGPSETLELKFADGTVREVLTSAPLSA